MSGDVFHTLSIIWDYIQGALRKMQLIAYFLDHFKKIEIRFSDSKSKIKLREVFYTLCLLHRAMYKVLHQRRN